MLPVGSGSGCLYTMKGAMMIKTYNRPAGVEMHPYSPTGTSPKGKHVTGFSVVYDSLRIQFLCHPGGGSLLSAQHFLHKQFKA